MVVCLCFGGRSHVSHDCKMYLLRSLADTTHLHPKNHQKPNWNRMPGVKASDPGDSDAETDPRSAIRAWRLPATTMWRWRCFQQSDSSTRPRTEMILTPKNTAHGRCLPKQKRRSPKQGGTLAHGGTKTSPPPTPNKNHINKQHKGV